MRCSRCHSDPAVGGATPGYPVSLYPEAAGLNLPTSSKTLSYVLHEGHNAKGPQFYDRVTNLGFANACEACHPNQGNATNPSAQCMRGLHRTEAGLNCTSCHGTLADRTAQGQLDDPWSYRTLPRCSTCHGTSTGEWTTAEIDSYGHQQFGGAFLNSRGHKNDVRNNFV